MRLPVLAKQMFGHITGLSKDRFFRRLAMLSGGVAAGQLFLALSTPLLTRLYTPEDFGVFAVIIAILAMFNGISNMRLETSIPVCRPEMLAVGLATTLFLAVCTVALLTLGITVAEFFLLPPTVGAELRKTLWVVPIAAFLGALALPFVYLRIRRGDFRTYGMVRMVRMISQGTGQVVFGFAGLTQLGLPLGYALGPGVSLLLLLRASNPEIRQLVQVRLRQIWAYIREHWRHPVYMMPSAILYEAVQFLPAVLLATLYSPEVAGFFTLSQRVLGLPIRFLSQSAGQVLLGEASESSRSEISQRVRTVTRQFAFLGTAITLPMVIIGASGWEFLFGERWGKAWIFVVSLSPMYLLRFVVDTICNVFVFTNTQHYRFIFSSALLLSSILSFIYGMYFSLDPIAVVVTYSIACSAIYALQIFIIVSLSMKYSSS